MGLADEQFEARVENLVMVMRDLNLTGDVIEAAGKVLQGTHNEMLCR